MRGGLPPISDEDLHGFVDSEIPPDQRRDVETYLASSPAAAERVENWRRQREIIRATFARVEAEPPPPAVLLPRPGRKRAFLSLLRPCAERSADGSGPFRARGEECETIPAAPRWGAPRRDGETWPRRSPRERPRPSSPLFWPILCMRRTADGRSGHRRPLRPAIHWRNGRRRPSRLSSRKKPPETPAPRPLALLLRSTKTRWSFPTYQASGWRLSASAPPLA